jgi:hypothetical protein
LVVRIGFDDLASRQDMPRIRFGDPTLKHALEGMNAKHQTLTHPHADDRSLSALPHTRLASINNGMIPKPL